MMKLSNALSGIALSVALCTCSGHSAPEQDKLGAAAVQGIVDAVLRGNFAHEFNGVSEIALTLEGFGADSPSHVGGMVVRPYRAEDWDISRVLNGGPEPRGLKVVLLRSFEGGAEVDVWSQRLAGGWYQRLALRKAGDQWSVDKVLAQALYL